MQEREGDDQTERPQCDEQEQRERAEYREHALPAVALGKSSRHGAPGCPQEPIEGPCRREPSHHAAGEDDGLERIPQDEQSEERRDDGNRQVHGRTLEAEGVLRKRTGLPQAGPTGAPWSEDVHG